ncbi:MAG: sigma-E factor negative regulatory protein [Proteobacteria bacterium]|nr:sigma-E factor negative regulatory protein [Pseudomonadota bacterium]
MSERLRESLSAVMDGEANELELERVLSRIGEDDELRQAWVRYNAVRSVNEGGHIANLSLDVSGRVRAAINEGNDGQALNKPAGLAQRFLKPLASFAVAASVAATVVIGGQQLYQIGEPDSYVNTLAGASPVGLINSVGATAVQASYGMQSVPVLQPTVRTAYRELARQRMERYMQEHVEQAALNTPQGLIPFSRVQQIQE